MTLTLRGVRPIPVGHRVEVVVFWIPGDGLFSPKQRQSEPLILDLETGVRYGTMEHFRDPPTLVTPGQSMTLPVNVRSLPTKEHWRGKVLVCNVVHTGISRAEEQTTLVIEPIPPPNPGYR